MGGCGECLYVARSFLLLWVIRVAEAIRSTSLWALPATDALPIVAFVIRACKYAVDLYRGVLLD